MRREDVRRWVAQQRLAQSHVRREHRGRPVDAQESLRRAFALIAFTNRFRDRSPDPLAARENRAAWEAWARLRRAWACRRQ